MIVGCFHKNYKYFPGREAVAIERIGNGQFVALNMKIYMRWGSLTKVVIDGT
jgi:hypothetical protein